MFQIILFKYEKYDDDEFAMYFLGKQLSSYERDNKEKIQREFL